MAGFLNKKSRFLDYKLTENGRNQLSIGDIRFKYYSFSDRSIFYEESQSEKNVSDSEFYYLPFEVSTDPGLYVNPEYYLTNTLTYDRPEDSFFTLKTVQKTLVESLSKKSYLNKKLFSNQKVSNDVSNSLQFKYIDKKDEIDFLSIINTRKYPTVKFLKENIEDIKSVESDKRFEDNLKFKKLIPVDINNNNIINTESVDNSDNINFIFKTLDIKNNITSEDTREEAITKSISLLEKSNNFFKFEYLLDSALIKSNDIFHFEVHEIINNELKKLPFINLGKLYDKPNNRYVNVFLIGKFILNSKLSEVFNEENRVLDRKSINKYCFVNLFTLVVE